MADGENRPNAATYVDRDDWSIWPPHEERGKSLLATAPSCRGQHATCGQMIILKLLPQRRGLLEGAFRICCERVPQDMDKRSEILQIAADGTPAPLSCGGLGDGSGLVRNAHDVNRVFIELKQ